MDMDAVRDAVRSTKETEERLVDSVVVSALPSGRLDNFIKYEQVLASKPVEEAGLSGQQVEESLRRLVKRRDERVVFYKDSTSGCYPDDFSSYHYKRAG